MAKEDNPDTGAGEEGKAPYVPAVHIRNKKQGAQMIDEFGKLETKRRPIDLDLSDLVLPPITRNGIAEYRVLDLHPVNPSSTMKEPPDPQTLILPGTYMFTDMGEPRLDRRVKLQKYIARPDISTDPITKKPVIDENIIEMIDFPWGFRRVDIMSQYRLYVFLELHPLNKSNRRRPRGVTPVFERIDIKGKASVEFAIAEQDMQFEAEKSIVEITDRDELLGIATSAGIPTVENGRARQIAHIKSDLRAYARANPKGFFSMVHNVTAAVRLNLSDAVGLGLIQYMHDKKRWTDYLMEKSLHTVAAGEDPFESLVAVMSKPDNQKLYASIVNLTNFWNRGDSSEEETPEEDYE